MKINILSLFDGMSCGQIALNKLGIKYNHYFASEIDKSAIKLTQHNFPHTIQIGDVLNVSYKNKKLYSNENCVFNGDIDLLIGGSPCTGFSCSGKQLNFNDVKSKLFFDYVRVLKEVKPKFFLLENVKMKKEWQDIITKYLGVEPIEINSSLVSAQNRVRLYWTNIPNIKEIKDKNINLKSILDDVSFVNPAAIRGRRLEQNKPIVQCLEVKKKNTNKSNCLTTVEKDNVLTFLKPGRYPNILKNKENLNVKLYRNYTIKEYCKLQTINYKYIENDVISNCQKKKIIGNGWTIDVICHILSFMKF